MKSKFWSYIIFLCLLVILACSKNQEALNLQESYMTVADMLEYCQGSCDEALSWENQTALVQGHIMSIESDSAMNENFIESRFYLQDIRNGMFMEVNIEDNKEDIFNVIGTGSKTSLFYIQGTTKAIIATENKECRKGVVLLLSDPNYIISETQ